MAILYIKYGHNSSGKRKNGAKKKSAPFFLYIENPTLGVGGSEALKAMKLDKKTPFGVG